MILSRYRFWVPVTDFGPTLPKVALRYEPSPNVTERYKRYLALPSVTERYPALPSVIERYRTYVTFSNVR